MDDRFEATDGTRDLARNDLNSGYDPVRIHELRASDRVALRLYELGSPELSRSELIGDPVELGPVALLDGEWNELDEIVAPDRSRLMKVREQVGQSDPLRL